MIPSIEVRHLQPWQEVVGILTELDDEETILLVKIGKIALALPIDMADVLRPHIDQRIAILRTDDPTKPYLFRSSSAKNETKNSPAGAGDTGRGDENCAQTTGATE
ncbi:MAG: hypothetical protein WCY97_05240 [Methanothrix sp.]|nr:hypothetical protein [Methanothrix sp.]MDI9399202.1 hypothetical protein [Euryarchaeota archaeon]